MAEKVERSGFWDRFVRFLAEVIEMAETLSDSADGPEKKKRALDLVVKWYRNSEISIPYLPRPLERWVIKRIASGMIDSLVEVLKSPALKSGASLPCLPGGVAKGFWDRLVKRRTQ